VTHHYAVCDPCCDAPPREPLGCDELPTSLLIAWSGAFEVIYSKCSPIPCTSLYVVGTVSAPGSISTTSNLFDDTFGECYYLGNETEGPVENTIQQRFCDPDEAADPCTIEAYVTIAGPFKPTAGAFVGYWVVTVAITFAAVGCDSAGYSCPCPLGMYQLREFIGPASWASPIGTYTAPAGSAWATDSGFPCDGASVVIDTIGSVTVS
jgi:hypothetical protein